MPSVLQAWTLPVALMSIVSITATWYKNVSHQVPDPYLVSSDLIDMVSY
jgi:alpha-1,2-glucosyltransferase